MKTDELEHQVELVLGRGMSAGQRNWLDQRVATAMATPRNPRRSLRFTRSAALAVGLSLLLAASFGVWAGQRSSEAPHGIQSAAAYEAERSAAMAVTPLPPGAAWPPSLSAPADSSAQYAVLAGQGEVEYSAACLWFGHWLGEHERGTAASQRQALAGLVQMRTWQTFSDPSVNRSIDYFESLVRAAEVGAADPIRAELTTNCGS